MNRTMTPAHTTMRVTRCQPKRRGRTEALFYQGEIATVTKPNGTVLSLMAMGEIQIALDGKTYRNSTIPRAVRTYRLTDARLRRLEDDGRLVWLLNNWFEVMWCKTGTETFESGAGPVAYTYDEALGLLNDAADDGQY